MSEIISGSDAIVALATAEGRGAISVVRLSGDNVIEIADAFSTADLSECKGNEVVYGEMHDEDGLIDECLISVFRAPRSYTKEDSIEISCHASTYIIKRLVGLFLRNQVRMADPGEFTLRAYINGQMDLSQAEAVADVIAASNAGQHNLAMSQLKGNFSKYIDDLRGEIVHFASLIELENDFAEEDVEFADRTELKARTERIIKEIQRLVASFQLGNAIKNGIPVAIVGPPNAGKSTLLNALLDDDKAIVSDIPGTTRDTIEDTIHIDGLMFRFIDTAGIRDTDDKIETLGIERSYKQWNNAQIVLYVTEIQESHEEIVAEFKSIKGQDTTKAIILLNKADDFHTCHSYDVEEAVSTQLGRKKTLVISAKEGLGLAQLRSYLVEHAKKDVDLKQDAIVTNVRHVDALRRTEESLLQVLNGLISGIPSDLIALDLRHALNSLGEITGKITTDDLLDNIFRNFCIGK